MVAVRQFDEDEALQRIMEAFWREGFGATSIDDLVAATGLKRGSLYAAFGDKEAMFLRAYRRYSETNEEALLGLLAGPDLSRAVTALFDKVLADLENPATPPGCLIANAMSEAAGRGDAIEAAVRRSFARAESAFYERFLRAQAEGQLPPGRDLRALARFFAAAMRTLALVHRLTNDRQTVADIAKVALERIG